MGIRAFCLAILLPVAAVWLLRDHPGALTQVSNFLTLTHANPTR